MTRVRRPWPLRIRLTAAVVAVTAVVLAITGTFVAREFVSGLDARTDLELKERGDTLRSLARDVPERQLLGVAGEALAQIYEPDGKLRESTRALGRRPLLDPAQVATGRAKPSLLTVFLGPDPDDYARALTFPVQGDRVLVIAEAREHREQELSRLTTLLEIGLGAALLLTALVGYLVAGAALRPVERIRSQAARISEEDPAARLPEPGTGDELDRLTATLNDLLGRLAGALERERRIVSDASHELRTPISILSTRLDVALRGRHDQEALETVVGEAREDVRRLARLADDLLVLARADQGRLPLRPQPIDVQDALEQVARRHEKAAQQAGRELLATVEIDGGAVLLADPDRLAQVLDNLVSNALNHGAGPIEMLARAGDGRTIKISVADRGGGFPDELLPRAFDRFSQGTDDGRADGAGLGLAIVAALAGALGGSAQAANRPGGGAIVTLTLRAA
ncbi:MAG: hypothetical protein QOG62_1476 [Thermoleophilaceae bacterium]|nr:hypothetical protein [Thermoleophilaceae bacterium]